MRTRITLFTILLVSFFSCTEAEEPIIEDPIAEDDKNPELTVNGFTEIIETYVDVSINIVDDSTVETKVMHEGEEIATSSEKQFDLSLSPYAIPVGSTDFIVTSTDAKGNETSETYSVEIKHLLMNYEYGAQESENGPQRWLFFNNLDGEELASIAPEVGDTKIYTDEIILENKIFYTQANYNVATYPNGSFKNLHLITYKVPLATTKPMGFYNNFVELENTVEVTLNDVPFVNGSPDYIALGRGYNTIDYSGDNLHTKLIIKHDASGPIYIRTNRFGGSTPKFDGKKENFSYLVFTPETGDTNILFEADQLKPAENTVKLDMPVHDPGSLFFARKGFKNAEDLAEFKSFGIYDKDSANETQMADYLDLPVLPMLDLYENYLSYAKNGHYYNITSIDSNLDVNMPNWAASVLIDDTNIEVTADNQEVDYYSARLNKNEYENNDGKGMHWILNVFEEDGNAKSIPRLALPTIISEAIEEPFFQTASDMVLQQLSAFDYAKFDSYDQIVDWHVFNKNKPAGNEYKYRQLSFPVSENSGKSDVANRPWGLDALHRYGLDEKGQIKIR